jgi:hypothetical protein
MMSWFSRINPIEVAEKSRRIEELEREIERYAHALQKEREAAQDYKKAIEHSARSASFEFDFKAVNVFSVERNMKDGVPVTIIGYLLAEPVVFTEGESSTKDVVREWYLYCDDKQHESVVKAFKDSRK